MNMGTLIYLNDQFIEGEKAMISPLDLSILRGYGVMDYLRTHHGKPFHLQKHLNRFVTSAEIVGLTVPKTIEEMEKIVEELIRRGNFGETGIKLILTGGVSQDQLLPEGPPTFFAVAYPFPAFPKRYFEEGIKIITECYQRPFPKSKTTQYLPAIMGMKRAAQEGAVDVLFHTEKGTLLETGTANFFAVKGGRVITPKEGILEGITREVAIELSNAIEQEISIKDIPFFEGAFLTSSNKEIMPVIQIDHHVINNGIISPVIHNLMNAFASYTNSVPVFL